MSHIAFIGPIEKSWRILQLLKLYDTVTESTNIPDLLLRIDSSRDATASVHPLNVANKYYTAQLFVHLLSTYFSTNDDKSPQFEALLFIDDENVETARMIGEFATNRNLALSLRIFYQHDDDMILTESAREQHLLWSIDYGFEFIEVYDSSLFADAKSRDKNGLPRIMEALQSVMWSSMEKRTVKSNVFEASAEATLPPPPPQDKSDNYLSLIEKADSTGYVPLSDENEDNEDEKLLDTFASTIQQAQTARAQALSATISDKERRDNAAAIAMKLLEIMGIDDDSDEN